MREAIKRESMSRPWLTSSIVLSAAVVGLSIGVLIPQSIIRAALVAPIALLLPGYAILLLAFGPHRRVDWVPALSLSLVLTTAFYPLAGLLLYAASIALSTRSLVAAVDLLVAGTLVVTFLRSRRHQEPTKQDSWLPAKPPRALETHRGLDGKRMLALTMFTLVLAGLGLGVALRYAPKSTSSPFTQFYLTGPLSHSSTPLVAKTGAQLRVTLGVTNRTQLPQVYRIEPRVDGTIAWQGLTVTLRPGVTWTGAAEGKMPGGGGLHHLIITIDTEPQATPIGALSLWVQSMRSR